MPTLRSSLLAALVLAAGAAACSKADDASPPAAASPASAAKAADADSPALAAGKQFVGILDEAMAAAEVTKGDCAAFGAKLDVIRPRLWDLGKANPGALKQLPDAELKALKAADRFEAVGAKLMECKDEVHAKEFAFAMSKMLD